MAVLAVVIAVGVLVWLQGFVYRRRWIRNTSLELFFSEAYATEGDKLHLTEVITNRKFLPLPWLAVKFQVSSHLWFTDHDNAKVTDDYYRHDLFNLLMFQRITRRLPFVCGKRGFYTVKSVDLISGDILAQSKFTQHIPCAAHLTVFPRMIDLDHTLTAHKQFLGQILTRRFIHPDPFEFKGIREYQPTDSLRTVNFKATAKTGALMVNQYDYTLSQEIVLLLNLQPYSAFPNDALYEQTIRLAATLAAYYVSQAIPISIVCNARGISWQAKASGCRDGLSTGNGAGGTSIENGTHGPSAGDGVLIESGSGAEHLAAINEALARIDLTKDRAQSGRDMLRDAAHRQEIKRREGREPAYILLSTYHEKDIADAYTVLTETGADALWIIPVLRDMDIAVPLTERVVRAEIG